jgi:hypothetical protein
MSMHQFKDNKKIKNKNRLSSREIRPYQISSMKFKDHEHDNHTNLKVLQVCGREGCRALVHRALFSADHIESVRRRVEVQARTSSHAQHAFFFRRCTAGARGGGEGAVALEVAWQMRRKKRKRE